MKRVPGWVWRIVDVAWLIALALYALAGYRNVPFHGDEATLIFMSHDYFTLVHDHDLDAVQYTADPEDPSVQELRIINGTIAKYSFGLAADLAGQTAADLNNQWAWGAGWDWNVTDNHMPGDTLLYAARLASALMLAASAWGVFAIGWFAGRGRWSAYAASLVYIMTPVVLINGRRAMMEGSMLLSTVLVVLAGIVLLRARAADRVRWWHFATLGVAIGLAVSSKHTNLILVVIVFALVTLTVMNARRGVINLTGAGILALIVFLLLNPAWWSDPLSMPGRIVEARSNLMTAQQVLYGSYDGTGQQFEGLIRRVADGTPQYYEVAVWEQYIGDAIVAYEGHAWTGITGGVIGAFVRLAGVVIGTAALLRRWHDPAARVVLVWWWGMVLALLLMTPFDWQRYYLPLQPALAILIGVAVAWLGGALQARRDSREV